MSDPVYPANMLHPPVPPPVRSRVTQKWQKGGHNGVDFAVPIGTLVTAAAEGVVVQLDAVKGTGPSGLYVILEHPGRVRTGYAHLSDVRVKIGQTVRRGETIALSGNTGKSTGPHLHWVVRVWFDGSWRTVDPLLRVAL